MVQSGYKNDEAPYSNGSKTFSNNVSAEMTPDTGFYVILGSRMSADWEGKYTSYDKWHHWRAELKTHVTDLYFTINP